MLLTGAALTNSIDLAQPESNARGPMRDFDFDFAALDADADGRDTPAEVAAFRTASTASTGSNADGLLIAAELAAVDIVAATMRANARAARQIKRLDANGDGQLSAAEVATRPDAMPVLDRIDTDGDGAITETEADSALETMRKKGGRYGPDPRAARRDDSGGARMLCRLVGAHFDPPPRPATGRVARALSEAAGPLASRS